MSYKWHHNFPKIAREAGFMIRELSIGHCIDWRFVASIDPYNIVSEQDYEKLDEFIPHISEVPIGTVLNNRILDPAIGKYFVLAQFSIQYLLFCKQFLDETVVEIRSSLQGLQNENARLEKMNKKRQEEVVLLQKKLQRVEDMHQHQAQQTTVFPCPKCTKNFISTELLNAHMVRKHANPRQHENYYERKSSNTDANLINTIKLELEVKQLKERLNVAEKDLLNHRSKHHHCSVCSEKTYLAHEDVKAKILHSTGIQTNLTDDKDSNDKEAHTQTEISLAIKTDATLSHPPEQPLPQGEIISKSDLQSFIEEQKQLFNVWKDGERQKFNEEFEHIKHNLVDAIGMMQKTEQTLAVPMFDEVLWKERYHELEKMFENSQQQTRDTMTTFERAYTTKMEHLETLLGKMLLQESKESLLMNNVVDVVEPVSHKSVNLKTVTLPKIVIEGDVRQESATSAVVIEESNIRSKNSSSESESTPSDEELQALATSKMLKISPTMVDEPPHVQSKQSSPKKQILGQFRARLKMIGIDAKSKQLSGEGLNDASEALAIRRDAIKKKHKHFFITRNQLLSKVDQMARVKMNEQPSTNLQNAHLLEEKPTLSNHDKFTLGTRVPASAIRLKSSPTLELLPSKHTLLFSGNNTNQSSAMNMFKTRSAATVSSTMAASRPIIKLTGEDVITVHAEIQPATSRSPHPPPRSPIVTKRPSISKYDEQVEKLLDTPIKTHKAIGIATGRQEQWETGTEERNSDISEMLDAVPAHPKPIPKKRVLFNLDKIGHSNITGSSPKKSLVRHSKQEEESDWNISSFDEDK